MTIMDKESSFFKTTDEHMETRVTQRILYGFLNGSTGVRIQVFVY